MERNKRRRRENRRNSGFRCAAGLPTAARLRPKFFLPAIGGAHTLCLKPIDFSLTVRLGGRYALGCGISRHWVGPSATISRRFSYRRPSGSQHVRLLGRCFPARSKCAPILARPEPCARAGGVRDLGRAGACQLRRLCRHWKTGQPPGGGRGQTVAPRSAETMPRSILPGGPTSHRGAACCADDRASRT